MKIERANLVANSWINCLNSEYEGLDPLPYGWNFDNDALSPIWYSSPASPTMDEIDRQSVTFSEVADETSDNESSDDDYCTDDDLCAHSESEILSNNEFSDDEY